MNGEGAGDCDCSSKATQHVAVEAAIEIAQSHPISVLMARNLLAACARGFHRDGGQ
jgi:hypothetical protein